MESEVQEHFEARLRAERMQHEAAQLTAQATHLASIGVIAAGITHEINQPLSAIQVHADMLLYLMEKKRYSLPEPLAKIFNEISEGTQRINNIIQHMRSFWVSSDSEPLVEVDLNEAIQCALTLTNRKMHSHSIRLKLELSADPVLIMANRVHVEQIVINLVMNSIHALDQKQSAKKEIVVKSAVNHKTATLAVRDNGIGLPTYEYDRLFSPFFSTKAPGSGMGLGLAIVKMFADRFKGEIEVEGNDEGGATFSIHFPAAHKDERQE